MTVMHDFHYLRPESIDAAVAALTSRPTAQPVAGATDLLPNLRRGLGTPEALVDLTAIPSLGEITEDAGHWRIGAAVPLADLARHAGLTRHFPVVGDAARAVAGPTHRASGTVGGNLCQDTRCVFYNQSEWWRESNDFCLKYQGDRCHVALKSKVCFATYRGDLAPALMVLGGQVELAGPGGRRTIPLGELYSDDGAAHLKLDAGEIVVAVTLPKEPRPLAGYAKVRVRDAIDFPLVGVAAALTVGNGLITSLKVAITGTNPGPVLANTEDLCGRSWDAETAKILGERVGKASRIQNTTTLGTRYRRRVLLASARRLVDGLWTASL